MEHIVHELKALVPVQNLGPDAQLLEVVQKIVLDVLQPGLGLLHGIRFDSEGQELGLGETVVALGQLCFKHLGILIPDTVELILLVRDPDPGLEALRVSRHVHEAELEMNGTVEEVQEAAPFLKDGGFVFLLG